MQTTSGSDVKIAKDIYKDDFTGDGSQWYEENCILAAANGRAPDNLNRAPFEEGIFMVGDARNAQDIGCGTHYDVKQELAHLFKLSNDIGVPICFVCKKFSDNEDIEARCDSRHWIFIFFIDQNNALIVDPFGSSTVSPIISQIINHLNNGLSVEEKKRFWISNTVLQNDVVSCGPISAELARLFREKYTGDSQALIAKLEKLVTERTNDGCYNIDISQNQILTAQEIAMLKEGKDLRITQENRVAFMNQEQIIKGDTIPVPEDLTDSQGHSLLRSLVFDDLVCKSSKYWDEIKKIQDRLKINYPETFFFPEGFPEDPISITVKPKEELSIIKKTIKKPATPKIYIQSSAQATPPSKSYGLVSIAISAVGAAITGILALSSKPRLFKNNHINSAAKAGCAIAALTFAAILLVATVSIIIKYVFFSENVNTNNSYKDHTDNASKGKGNEAENMALTNIKVEEKGKALTCSNSSSPTKA